MTVRMVDEPWNSPEIAKLARERRWVRREDLQTEWDPKIDRATTVPAVSHVFSAIEVNIARRMYRVGAIFPHIADRLSQGGPRRHAEDVRLLIAHLRLSRRQ